MSLADVVAEPRLKFAHGVAIAAPHAATQDSKDLSFLRVEITRDSRFNLRGRGASAERQASGRIVLLHCPSIIRTAAFQVDAAAAIRLIFAQVGTPARNPEIPYWRLQTGW